MKALILAAGYGTRLRPHTTHIPKPLFPVAGQPLIDLTIRRLMDQGITAIIINVHHLHQQITAYIKSRNYPIPVVTRYEERILGTGGAIRNVADFLDDQPFLVINSDIVTDIDVSSVFDFHRQHGHPATLVTHDYPMFNKVWTDDNDNILAFSGTGQNLPPNVCCRAFTGIQVLAPVIMDHIPEKDGLVSSIDVYQKMIRSGLTIKAYTAKNHYWRDIGTPESYARAVYDHAAPIALAKAFGPSKFPPVERTLLAGDGSDRRWYRMVSGSRRLIMGDHGINADSRIAEVDSFVNIGNHLFQQNIPVPKIFYSDGFAGQVYVEDLGDTHLQAVIAQTPDPRKIIRIYQQVIDQVLRMSISGADGFDPAWTYQSSAYDRDLILDKECRYFVDAFLNTCLNMEISYADLAAEFQCLADHTLENAVTGFMHRDLQSRNIMIHAGRIFFIDFQGARTGPIQYDLASLLTDPYVDLTESIQNDLLDYSTEKLARLISSEKLKFIAGYRYCSITRILQSLGAFGCLSKIKHKPFFEQFIPVALKNLNLRLESSETPAFPLLTETVKNALILLHARD